MGVKLNNLMSFYSSEYNTHVNLVKRSVGRYKSEKYLLTYWTGQLVHNWSPQNPDTGELMYFRKGQKVWLDANLFKVNLDRLKVELFKNQNNMTQFAVDDKVKYTDNRVTRTGTIIEINEKTERARINWDEKRPRTWIRMNALIKVNKSVNLPPFNE